MKLDRRGLLGGTATLGLAACATTRGERHPASLGLADITISKELARDYAGTLKQASAMGYSHFGFRLSGYGPSASEPSPQDKARMVHDAGLNVGVVRFGVRNVDYDRQIGQAAEIGAKIVAITAAPPFISGRQLGVASRAAFDAWLPELATLAGKCRAAGLTLAYHNHWWDLAPLDGDRPLDILARSISPVELSFEIDLAWCWYAGMAPLELLAQLGPRVASMHFKDIDRSRGKSITDHAVVIGSGEMNYAALLPRIPALTSAIGFIEVDSPDDGLAAAAQGIRVFREASR